MRAEKVLPDQIWIQEKMSFPFVMQARESSKQGRWWEKVDALELWHWLLEGLRSAKGVSEVADQLGETQSWKQWCFV